MLHCVFCIFSPHFEHGRYWTGWLGLPAGSAGHMCTYIQQWALQLGEFEGGSSDSRGEAAQPRERRGLVSNSEMNRADEVMEYTTGMLRNYYAIENE